jgi:lipoprotein-anchoring transpeptidase ErfK/SrfK
MKITARALATVVLIGGLAALTGCGAGSGSAWKDPGGSGAGSGGERTRVSISAPADGATEVPTSTEIALANTGDSPATVTFTDASGASVPGALTADGAAWQPEAQLKYATAYTATVSDGGKESAKVTFTTMAKPKNLINVSTTMSDGKVYGVAMPIVVRFGKDVAKDQRANVEKRLLVTSEPPQVGVWHWFSGSEVHYRPKEYWQPGTKISARLATGGLPLGGTAYGAKDVTINAAIGEKIMMVTDDATHTTTVTKGDQVLRTIPVSLGKASTPSSSGHMVIMDKNESELFVSTDPDDPYRETVYWTLRITTGGEYFHAAPWSVGDQGKRNVSHGCTNMSTENAKWLYGLAQIGDPVIVKGTPRQLRWGNGWTDWDRPWEEYVKGSALPPPAVPATPDPAPPVAAE